VTVTRWPEGVEPRDSPRRCARCGAAIWAMRPNARFCSAKCRQRGHRGDEKARAARNGSPRPDARVSNPIVLEQEIANDELPDAWVLR
jgi:predicted nucleic acid-binding Zn ribbon protein